MTTYTMTEATTRLSELVGKAVAGEEVVIAQQDGDLVRLVPEEPMSEAEREAIRQARMEWLSSRRVAPLEPVDSTALIRQMRDECL